MVNHLTNTLQHIGNAIHAITQGSAIGSALVGACAAVMGFITPIQWLLWICFAMTVVDMI